MRRIKYQDLSGTISLTRFVLIRGFSTSSQLLRSISKPVAQVTKMVGSIGTHDGKFHCDEAFACFILKRLNQFRDYKLIRTRDPAVLNTCDVIVDVGGVYNHSKKRYDHHQIEFNETMQTLGVLDFNTRLSSAGLIYAHYGKQLIAEVSSNVLFLPCFTICVTTSA
ncbi:unnamed protein product [Strongylus vulgaris]|uniref:Uncharacterized protein n=1 Tax=Strongylus vulgaris TaxID=40348 RepID=A0A3P7ISB1_STRVU|nr:unnamed protein product [Strongylus vulgaris]